MLDVQNIFTVLCVSLVIVGLTTVDKLEVFIRVKRLLKLYDAASHDLELLFFSAGVHDLSY